MESKIDILLMSVSEKIAYLEYAKQRASSGNIEGYLCDTMLIFRFQIAKNYCDARDLLKKNFDFTNIDTSNNRGGWFKSKGHRLSWINEQLDSLNVSERKYILVKIK